MLGITKNRPWKKQKWLLSLSIASFQLLTKNIPLAFIILFLLCVSHVKTQNLQHLQNVPRSQTNTYLYKREGEVQDRKEKIYISNTFCRVETITHNLCSHCFTMHNEKANSTTEYFGMGGTAIKQMSGKAKILKIRNKELSFKSAVA